MVRGLPGAQGQQQESFILNRKAGLVADLDPALLLLQVLVPAPTFLFLTELCLVLLLQ